VVEGCLFPPSPVAFTLFVGNSGTEQGSFCSYSRSSSRFPLEHHRKTNYSGKVRVILFGGGQFWCPSPIRNLIKKSRAVSQADSRRKSSSSDSRSISSFPEDNSWIRLFGNKRWLIMLWLNQTILIKTPHPDHPSAHICFDLIH